MCQALFTTTAVTDWLKTAASSRVLHVFDEVCNLVDGNGRVLSLVTPAIGNGPFSLVVDLAQDSFTDFITTDSPIRIHPISHHVFQVGSLVLNANEAVLWEARPLWESVPPSAIKACLPLFENKLVESSQDSLAHVNGRCDLTSLKAKTAITLLQEGLKTGDLAACQEGARGLTGLGVGLTPAGDDYLLGVIYGLWLTEASSRRLVLSDVEVDAKAQRVVEILAEEAGVRTTTLSAAWLRAAARGEAGEPWHKLVEAMRNRGEPACTEPVTQAINRILSTGHTSGADALAGFVMAIQNAPTDRLMN